MLSREIHPLDPQPHTHSMLVPTVCAPRVTRCSLGKYWSRDWFRGNFSLTQGLWNQQAANPGVHMLSMTHSGVRQRLIWWRMHSAHSLSTTPRCCLCWPPTTQIAYSKHQTITEIKVIVCGFWRSAYGLVRRQCWCFEVFWYTFQDCNGWRFASWNGLHVWHPRPTFSSS